MCSIIIPFGYFVYIFTRFTKLREDKRNNFAIVKSGKITDKKTKRVGTGKSSTHLYYLYSGEDKQVVDKRFYNQINVGEHVEIGILPLSEIMVLQKQIVITNKENPQS